MTDTSSRSYAEDFEISGEVLDTNDQLLENVSVIVWRGTTLVSEGRTQDRGADKGKYSIKFPRGSRIKITYEHTKYVAARVEDLSGQRNHSIKKVMLPGAARLSSPQAWEALTTYDFILQERSKTVATGELREKYTPILRALNVPSELEGQRRAVIQRYELE